MGADDRISSYVGDAGYHYPLYPTKIKKNENKKI